MFRATAGGDTGNDLGQKLADRMMGKKDTPATKQAKRKQGQKDLSLNQVETLKNALQKHLKEINKLNTVNNGRDGKQVDDNFDDGIDSDTSSDEEELNRQIAAVKKMIQQASAVLRGEDEDIMIDDSVALDTLPQEKDVVDKTKERELALAARKKQLEAEHVEGEEQYKSKIRTEGETAVAHLEDMKNKVLEQQVESAFDRGKAF